MSVPLTGGRMTPGVVRVGDRVHRPASAASAFVAALLELFEEKGFDGAPRHLGRQDGADVLAFIPGEVPARFQPWEDRQVAAAGRLLRAMHDATRGSALAGRCQVVCHHDPGPNNAVFRDGLPVAWIDFDTAAPGSPLEDVGYAAWTWCITSKPARPVGRQAAQVRVLADAYGLGDVERGVLVDAVLERLARNVRFWAEVRLAGTPPVEPGRIAELIAWSRREAAFTARHRDVFDAALA